VSSIKGYKSVQRTNVELLRVLAANPWQTFWLLRLPAAVPSLFAALDTAAVASVRGVVVREWIGADQGSGVVMLFALFEFQTAFFVGGDAGVHGVSAVRVWPGCAGGTPRQASLHLRAIRRTMIDTLKGWLALAGVLVVLVADQRRHGHTSASDERTGAGPGRQSQPDLLDVALAGIAAVAAQRLPGSWSRLYSGRHGGRVAGCKQWHWLLHLRCSGALANAGGAGSNRQYNTAQPGGVRASGVCRETAHPLPRLRSARLCRLTSRCAELACATTGGWSTSASSALAFSPLSPTWLKAQPAKSHATDGWYCRVWWSRIYISTRHSSPTDNPISLARWARRSG
jgi:hypothetical protein